MRNSCDLDNGMKSFPQHSVSEKREAAEATRLTANLDIPPLTDEDLAVVADELFVELDRAEAKDAKSESR